MAELPPRDAAYWERAHLHLAEVYNQQSRKLSAQQRRADRMESRAIKAERHLRHFEFARLPVIPGQPDPADAAWFSVWLHGNWRFLTGCMTTEEREAAADAVDRHTAHVDAGATAGATDDALGDVSGLRWWREDHDG